MTIPAVMFIEMALDSLKRLATEIPKWPPLVDDGPKTTSLDREVKEFRMLGNRDDNLGAVRLSPLNVHPEAGDDRLTERERGYLLGLETARVLLAMQPDAVRAGVTL